MIPMTLVLVALAVAAPSLMMIVVPVVMIAAPPAVVPRAMLNHHGL